MVGGDQQTPCPPPLPPVSFLYGPDLDVLKSSETTPLDYKTLDQDKFINEPKLKLKNRIVIYGDFEKLFVELLNKDAPMKAKSIRTN